MSRVVTEDEWRKQRKVLDRIYRCIAASVGVAVAFSTLGSRATIWHLVVVAGVVAPLAVLLPVGEAFFRVLVLKQELYKDRSIQTRSASSLNADNQ